MRAADALRLIWLVATACLLGACDRTFFESAPEPTVACDAQFVGTWTVASPEEPTSPECKRDEAANCVTLVVDPGCTGWHFLENGVRDEINDADIAKHAHVAFANLHGRKLLSLGIDQADNDDARRAMNWSRAFLLYRYEASSTVVRLYAVDTAQADRWLLEKRLRGHANEPAPVPKKGEFEHHFRPERTNFIAGDARETRRVALLPKAFEDEPILLLKRVDPADIVKPAPTAATP